MLATALRAWLLLGLGGMGSGGTAYGVLLGFHKFLKVAGRYSFGGIAFMAMILLLNAKAMFFSRKII